MKYKSKVYIPNTQLPRLRKGAPPFKFPGWAKYLSK